MSSNYIYVENGNLLQGPGTLPRNWRNISGLDGFSEQELKEMNWIIVTGEKPEYDPTYQTISAPVISITGTDKNYSAEATWTVSFRGKDEILYIRNQEVDNAREENIARGALIDVGDSNGPFTVQTRGELDTRNINGLAGVATSSILLAQPFSADFRDQDDQVHNLTAQQVLMLQSQVAVWVQSHYYVAWSHKAAIKSLYDADELQAMIDYDISQGWP